MKNCNLTTKGTGLWEVWRMFLFFIRQKTSAKEMESHGTNLGKMSMVLRKIEELTLYSIDQRKELDELKQRSVGPDPSRKKIEELTL